MYMYIHVHCTLHMYKLHVTRGVLFLHKALPNRFFDVTLTVDMNNVAAYMYMYMYVYDNQ